MRLGAILRPAIAVIGLAVLAYVLAPGSRSADAQVSMWTSCRTVCAASCRLSGQRNARCEDSAECKKLDGYFAPQDPRVDSDAKVAALRLGQCKRCGATGKPGRCPLTLFGMTGMGGAAYGGRSYGGSRYGGGRDRIGALARCFEQSARDQIASGYTTKNYSFLREVRAASPATNPFSGRSRGGRAGEYAAWGVAWIKPCVDRYFPGALADELLIEAKAGAHKKRVPETADSIYDASHRATRVVLPDGRRVVVESWHAIDSGQPRLQMQTAWIAAWRERIGADAVVQLSDEEVLLKQTVKKNGEAKGLAAFEKAVKNRKNGNGPLWVTSWQREPW
jgi:hypothetical protein